MRDRIKELNVFLTKYANNLNKLSSLVDMKFMVGSHFVQRLGERFGTWNESMIFVAETVDINICKLIYYRHLDTIPPDRGEIRNGDWVIRTFVKDDIVVLATIFKQTDIEETVL